MENSLKEEKRKRINGEIRRLVVDGWE